MAAEQLSIDVPQLLVLVRHASTAWSRSGQHTGRTDLPLDAEGVRSASDLGARLLGYRGAAVYSSPLRRARDTCALSGFGEEVTETDDLLEWDYGDYEGRRTVDITAERPGWDLFRDGCPNGETAADVGARADHFLDDLRRRGDPMVVAFSHGHVLRVVAARWLGLGPISAELWTLDAPSVSELGHERHTRVIHSWNT